MGGVAQCRREPAFACQEHAPLPLAAADGHDDGDRERGGHGVDRVAGHVRQRTGRVRPRPELEHHRCQAQLLDRLARRDAFLGEFRQRRRHEDAKTLIRCADPLVHGRTVRHRRCRGEGLVASFRTSSTCFGERLAFCAYPGIRAAGGGHRSLERTRPARGTDDVAFIRDPRRRPSGGGPQTGSDEDRPVAARRESRRSCSGARTPTFFGLLRSTRRPIPR